MAKKRIEILQKSWRLEEIFPRFVNAQMAKGASDKTIQTYHRHFRSLGHHLDMTMTFDELKKDTLDSMAVSLRLAAGRFLQRCPALPSTAIAINQNFS